MLHPSFPRELLGAGFITPYLLTTNDALSEVQRGRRRTYDWLLDEYFESVRSFE